MPDAEFLNLMEENVMRSVRIKMSKSGQAIYISHLDVNRLILRAVRRAGLPLWYTEGFNPHPYVSFALPLPLGQESECEYIDIRITEDISDSEIMDRLNSVLPAGFKILNVGEPVGDFKEIYAAEYFIKLIFNDNSECEKFKLEADKLLSSDTLTSEKKVKKGHRKIIKEINLIEYIKEYKVTSTNNILNYRFILSAGNTDNLNPALLISALENECGVFADSTSIVRKKLILNNGRSLSCRLF